MTFKAIEGLLPDNIVQLFHTCENTKLQDCAATNCAVII